MLHFLALYAALIDPRWEVRESASASILHLVDRHPAVYGPRLGGMSQADADDLLARMFALEVRSKCDCGHVPAWTGWNGGLVRDPAGR